MTSPTKAPTAGLSEARPWTPGPWQSSAGNGYGSLNGAIVREPRGLVLAVAIGDVPELAPEANARLIAAAPNLAEVSQELFRLGLVIESAVRNADPANHAAVLALIYANIAALQAARGTGKG